MTARQMQIEFERLIQLMDPEFMIANKLDSETIFYFLNAAQERFIKLNYMSLDTLKETVENLRKNTDAFKALIVTKKLTTGTALDNSANGKRFELPASPTDYFFLYLRSESSVTGTFMEIPESSPSVVPNKLITHDDIEKILTSYYNKPVLRQPCAVLEADTTNKTYINVYTDSYTTLKDVTINYIRKPRKFNVIKPDGSNIVDACELSENVHQDIVELAVDMFITEAAYRLSGVGRQAQRTQPNQQ